MIAPECPTGDDCHDGDARIHPGLVGEWYGEANDDFGFDYDCDGAETPEFEAVTCSGVCSPKTNVFLYDAACGTTGQFGDCNFQVVCVEAVEDPNRLRRCR